MKKVLFLVFSLLILCPSTGHAFFEPVPENSIFNLHKDEINESVAYIVASEIRDNLKYPFSGTGFYIGDKYLLTALHIVYSRSIDYVLLDGKKYGASVVGSSVKDDLAILKLESVPKDITPFEFAKDVSVGDTAIAIGYPGSKYAYAVGEVMIKEGPVYWKNTGLDYVGTRQNMSLTFASKGGLSGSPIINNEGQVIGVVVGSAKLDDKSITLATSLSHLRLFMDLEMDI